MSCYYFELSVICFNTYFILIPFSLLLAQYWFFFIKNNFYYLRIKPKFFDKLQQQNFFKKTTFRLLLRYIYTLSWLFFLNFFCLKGVGVTFFWNHLYASNFNFWLLYYMYLFCLLSLTILIFYTKSPMNLGFEYMFTICNLNIAILFLFLANNLYSLFFFLELITVFVFYKFTVSKFWFSTKSKFWKTSVTKFVQIFPRYFLNMLFFQYWSAFFSSILILFSFITVTMMYGTTDWFLLNFFFKINSSITYFEKKEFFLILFPLFFGVIIKLGITPIHLYKIEIYKGLPFISIFFYTTYYFLVYFTLLFVLFFYYLITYSEIVSIFYLIIVLVGGLYFLSILFDGLLIKSFFAFSTIINALNFILVAFVVF